MTAHETQPEETATHDFDAKTEEDWFEEEDELPRRPRRRLLAPVPLALIAVLLLAGGFLAGVEVEKGQGPASSSGGLAAGLAALRGTSGASSAGGSQSSSRTAGGFAGAFLRGGTGFPGAGGLTTGEVSYLRGSTLYVTDAEGNTVRVHAPAGTKVSKTVSAGVKSIHPGDTVIVRGSQSSNGSVTASSISVSPGGSSASGGSGASGTLRQLFGAG
jgi:hypothetical protein